MERGRTEGVCDGGDSCERNLRSTVEYFVALEQCTLSLELASWSRNCFGFDNDRGPDEEQFTIWIEEPQRTTMVHDASEGHGSVVLMLPGAR